MLARCILRKEDKLTRVGTSIQRGTYCDTEGHNDRRVREAWNPDHRSAHTVPYMLCPPCCRALREEDKETTRIEYVKRYFHAPNDVDDVNACYLNNKEVQTFLTAFLEVTERCAEIGGE